MAGIPGLADVLVSRGGYNATDAANAASGGRAADLAKEFGVSAGGGSSSYPIPNISMNDIGGSAVDFEKNNIEPGIDNAFSQYLMASRSQAKPLDIYSGLENQAGLPQLRTTQKSLSDQVNTLEDTLRGIEPMVNATTTNSLVTEGQRTGMVNAKRYPVQQLLDPTNVALGRVSQNIDRTSADIGTKVGLAVQGQQMELEPYKQQVQLMSDRAARLMTGFTSDRETKLNLLLEKIHAEQHVSDQEFATAAALAKDERDYQAKMKEITAQMQADIQKSNETYKAMNKYGYVNPSTGQTIPGAGTGTGVSSYAPNFNSSSGQWQMVNPAGQVQSGWQVVGQ